MPELLLSLIHILAAAAEAAIRAKAKIHSPSKVSDKLGGYYGIGFGNGILDKVKYVKKAVMHLIDIPTMVCLLYTSFRRLCSGVPVLQQVHKLSRCRTF